MAKFFVGQRVRIVGAVWLPIEGHPYGEPGVITAASTLGVTSFKWFEWGVETESGRFIACDSSDLEPILYDGAAPSKYSYTELMDKCREGEGVAA